MDAKYENGIIMIPSNAAWAPALDQVGMDGWMPWAILGIDPETQAVRVAVTRRKRAIELATTMPNGLIKN